MIPGRWTATLVAPDQHLAQQWADMLEPHVAAVSWQENAAGWRVTAYGAGAEDAAAVARLAPEAAVEPLAERNWIRENRLSFTPQRAGRFFVHGSDFRAAVPAGAVALHVDAATAFGSGNHATTQGCLLAIDRVARRRRPWSRDAGRVFDLGCGSGILALAAAKALRRPVLAADVDPEAVRVTRANARLNGVARFVHVVRADGPRRRAVVPHAPFALILANILAWPLLLLAPALARALAPGGSIVLSGLLDKQAHEIQAHYRRQGLKPVGRYRLAGWTTLVLQRPHT